jgi:hypothetical protein
MPLGTVFRTTTKLVVPTAIKTAFWGTVIYYGPAATLATLGPVPLVGTILFLHLGGPELLTLIM